MKKTTILGRFTFWMNGVAAFFLIVSFVLPYLPPKHFPTVSLLSLIVSPLIFLNIIFALYWILLGKLKLLLSSGVLIMAYFFFNSFLQFSSEGNAEQYDATLKVMSYNVRLFNAYEKNSSVNVSETLQDIIESKKPDVICIQEYYRDESIGFSAYPYQYIYFNKKKNSKGVLQEHILGHAILSKYPIVNKGAFDFRGTFNNSLYVDVVKSQDTIRIYNFHLESLGVQAKVSYLQVADTKRLLGRMSNSFKEQQVQVEEVLAHKALSPYPVLFIGDFNNTPFSYIYREIQKDMKDSYLERGNGLGTTYLFDSYPMRIDYIFASEAFDVLNFETIRQTFSDHYPIISTVGWPAIPEIKTH
ncbi:endonuclease/exonuclease/phosphatase family protein [Ulvibacter sp.]|nr:endonuclease/exonuclease/phosphatase family protein [Ulvibacter sp.]